MTDVIDKQRELAKRAWRLVRDCEQAGDTAGAAHAKACAEFYDEAANLAEAARKEYLAYLRAS